MQSRTKNSIVNLLTGFLGQMVVTVLRFVSRTVFISTLGQAYLGIGGLFSDILSMLSLTELGIDTAINFKLYKPIAENDTKQIQLIMKFYKTAYTVVGVVMLLLGLAIIPFLPLLVKDYSLLDELNLNGSIVFLLYLGKSVITYLFFASRSAIIKADQKQYIINLTNTIVTIVSSIAQIIVLYVTFDFMLYLIIQLGFLVLQNLINAAIAYKKYPGVFERTKENLSKQEIKEMFKDLGAVSVSKLNTVVLKATDNIVLGFFKGFAVIALYSNYLLFYTTIKNLLFKVYAAVRASLGNVFATETMEKKYLFFEIMNYVSIIMYGTCTVGIAVVADELLDTWIGNTFVIPQPFALLIGIEILFAGLKQNLMTIRNVSGLFKQMWFRPVLGTIVNLVASVVLVNVCGIYGVIIGTILADVLTNFCIDPGIIHKYAFENYKSVVVYYKRNIRYLLELALVGVIDYFICRYFFTGHGWFSVIVHSMICGISVPLFFILVYWKSYECKYIVEKARNLLAKKA